MTIQKIQTEDDLLTASEVASEMLDGLVTTRTVESWRSPRRAQPLAFVKVGHRRFYTRGAVRAWLAANTVTAAPATKA